MASSTILIRSTAKLASKVPLTLSFDPGSTNQQHRYYPKSWLQGRSPQGRTTLALYWPSFLALQSGIRLVPSVYQTPYRHDAQFIPWRRTMLNGHRLLKHQKRKNCTNLKFVLPTTVSYVSKTLQSTRFQSLQYWNGQRKINFWRSRRLSFIQIPSSFEKMAKQNWIVLDHSTLGRQL